MDDNHKGHFDAALPLPSQPGSNKQAPDDPVKNPAADLIRQRVQAAYGAEPSAETEAVDVVGLGSSIERSKHQQFIYDLTSQGKSLVEVQQAWHEYYAGLPDEKKHQVWQEFYSAHAQASHYGSLAPALISKKIPLEAVNARSRPRLNNKQLQTLYDLRDAAFNTLAARKRLSFWEHMHSMFFGMGVGGIVVIIFLFGFFNERFIAPFIQPSRNITSTPIISGNDASSSSPEIIIPKINAEIPVVYGVDTIDETAVENALENGVVHYADTADPGQNGNVVIVGHSSNNIFNKGKYKFAFALLSRLESGDTFYIQKDGKRYTYQVYKKDIVDPTAVGVLGPADRPAVATLITCDPPGTSVHRLVVQGQQISPDPGSNLATNSQNSLATRSAIIPGNAPSLWSRLVGWFTH